LALADYYVHESSFIDEGAQIGEDSKIWHFCHVMTGARIGRNCVLGQNVLVASGVVIGDNVKIQSNVSLFTGVVIEDNVFLGPSVVFTNVINPRSFVNRGDDFLPTHIRQGSSVGANATIICGVTLGAYSFVGAGSVVTKDVPDFGLVYGNPARLMGWMCRCGEQLNFRLAGQIERAACTVCGLAYIKQGQEVSPKP
jgi:UDP-2-acetamido-3-amino-2,3-dideoxy-glucuronate N-acetyltransferase